MIGNTTVACWIGVSYTETTDPIDGNRIQIQIELGALLRLQTVHAERSSARECCRDFQSRNPARDEKRVFAT